MLTFTSIQAVFVFNALTFVWSAALVLGVRIPARVAEAGPEPESAAQAQAQEPGEGFFREVTAGYREILASRDLRLLIGLYCAQTVVAGASLVFTVSIALGLLDIGHSGLGYLNATLGVGGLVGGFLALVLAQRGRLARDFGVGVLLWSAPLVLVAAWPTLGTAVAVMVVLGLANSIVDVNAFTILQRIAPQETMARVFGAMESAVIGGMALGALLMPLLIATVGLRWGLVVIGVGVGAVVVARHQRSQADRPDRARPRGPRSAPRRVAARAAARGDARTAGARARPRRGGARRGVHPRGRPRRALLRDRERHGGGDERRASRRGARAGRLRG